MKRINPLIASAFLFSALLCGPSVLAQGPIEGGLKAVDGWVARQMAKPGSLAAAMFEVRQAPRNFRVRVHDLAKGDLYCEIQSVNIDQSTGWMSIDFDYRGGTRVNLTPVSDDSRAMRGAYKINLPLMGDSDVQVNLAFSPDGSARGEWRNMGFSGAFDIARR